MQAYVNVIRQTDIWNYRMRIPECSQFWCDMMNILVDVVKCFVV